VLQYVICDADGNFSITTNANDDSTTNPQGSFYSVAVTLSSQKVNDLFRVIVPRAAAPTVDLFSLSRLGGLPPSASSCVESLQGLNGAVTVTSPDESVTVGTDGNAITLEASGGGGGGGGGGVPSLPFNFVTHDGTDDYIASPGDYVTINTDGSTGGGAELPLLADSTKGDVVVFYVVSSGFFEAPISVGPQGGDFGNVTIAGLNAIRTTVNMKPIMLIFDGVATWWPFGAQLQSSGSWN
jgi:hypothetical protein